MRQSSRTVLRQRSNGVRSCLHAPYDRALLTAAAERLPPAILDQIKPGGRIVLPLGPDEAQRLTVVDKGADGQTSVRQLIPVRFSRLETVV